MARLRELMEDMGWDDDIAIAELYREVAKPQGHTKKAVEQWFSRSLPPSQLFNIAAALGVDPGWLSGMDLITKKQAIFEGGLCWREIEREERRRPKKRTS